MTKQEQAQIVTALLDWIKSSVLREIKEGRVPERWDGQELRQYVADVASGQTSKMNAARKKDYNRVLSTTNIAL